MQKLIKKQTTKSLFEIIVSLTFGYLSIDLHEHDMFHIKEVCRAVFHLTVK
jgi:hypothetical protein